MNIKAITGCNIKIMRRFVSNKIGEKICAKGLYNCKYFKYLI